MFPVLERTFSTSITIKIRGKKVCGVSQAGKRLVNIINDGYVTVNY